MSDMRLSLILQAVDRISRPVARASQAVHRFSRSVGFDRIAPAADRAGRAIGGVADQAGRLAGKAALAGGAGAYLFKTQFLDVAAAFEKYQTILETTEGSEEKARKSMAWVNEFAATTPYALDEVVASFVKLRSRGLDPTTGLLTTLGDTAAAMGKSVDQAVEAITDAMTGEFERLKELGITSRTQGNKTMFEYVKNGETVRKVVDRRNKAMIVSTLQAIWNDQYGGQMDKLSTKWVGMMSNLGDWWTRFANMVMENGVFEWMKAQAESVLNSLNTMAASGALEALAADVGRNLLTTLKELWNALQAGIEIAREVGAALTWLKDLFGSWKPVIAIAAAIVAGPLIAALLSATAAIFGLGTALMATPIGWLLAAGALIAGVAGLIYENWDRVADWLLGVWDRIKIAGQELKVFFLDIVAAIGDMVGKLIGFVPESMRSTFGLDGLSDALASLEQLRKQAGLDLGNMQSAAGANGAARTPASGLGLNRADVGGELKITIDGEGRPRVRELRSNNPNFGIQVDTGLTMAGG